MAMKRGSYQVGYPKTAVGATLKRFLDTGSTQPQSVRTGRPTLISSPSRAALKEIVNENRRLSIAQLTNTFNTPTYLTLQLEPSAVPYPRKTLTAVLPARSHSFQRSTLKSDLPGASIIRNGRLASFVVYYGPMSRHYPFFNRDLVAEYGANLRKNGKSS